MNRATCLSIPTILSILLGVLCPACGEHIERPPPPDHDGIYSVVNGCYAMDATRPGSSNTRWLAPGVASTPEGEVEAFAFSAAEEAAGSRLFLRASDLGTYLFYDAEGRYLTAEDGILHRRSELLSDIMLLDDSYRSPAEWELQVSTHDAERFQLRHYRTGHYLTTRGLDERASEAAVIALYPRDPSECRDFPELTVDASGAV
ncbi:MAG: hypothetical protein AAGC55_24340, partial [Myxococcota bacterium]